MLLQKRSNFIYYTFSLNIMFKEYFFDNILTDGGIKKAIDLGLIRFKHPISDEQFQPASLDVRIGDCNLWDEEVREAMHRDNILHPKSLDLDIDRFSSGFAKKIPYQENRFIDISPHSHIEIHLLDQFEWDQDKLTPFFDLRSGRGRQSLWSNIGQLLQAQIKNIIQSRTTKESLVIHPGIRHSELMRLFGENQQVGENFLMGENISLFVAIENYNPNPIRLYQGDKFAQIFFSIKDPKLMDILDHGYIVSSKDLEKLDDKLEIDPPTQFNGLLLNFYVGNRMFRFKTDIDVIDTRKKYSDSELYYEIDLDTYIYSHSPGDALIVSSLEKVNLSNKFGIQLLHKTPITQQQVIENPDISLIDNFKLNAGWVDPGYNGNISGHPRLLKNFEFIKQGNHLAQGLVYYFPNGTQRSYGDKGLNSHYINSNGVSAKS